MDDDLDTLYSQPVQNVDEWRDLFEKVYQVDTTEDPVTIHFGQSAEPGPICCSKDGYEPFTYKPTLWERFLMWVGRLLGFE